jgi:hypothetical protein
MAPLCPKKNRPITIRQRRPTDSGAAFRETGVRVMVIIAPAGNTRQTPFRTSAVSAPVFARTPEYSRTQRFVIWLFQPAPMQL